MHSWRNCPIVDPMNENDAFIVFSQYLVEQPTGLSWLIISDVKFNPSLV